MASLVDTSITLGEGAAAAALAVDGAMSQNNVKQSEPKSSSESSVANNQWKLGFDPKQKQDFRRSIALKGQRSGRSKLLERIRKLEEADAAAHDHEDIEGDNNNEDGTKNTQKNGQEGGQQDQAAALERILEGLEVSPTTSRRNFKRGLEKEESEDFQEEEDGSYSKYFRIEQSSSSSISKDKHHKQRRVIMPCQLMYSEWFISPPDDFDKWYGVVCPAGKRCLVFANNCFTRVFGRNGKLIASFKSLLPGGGVGHDRQHAITLLDCVWSKKYNTMYVLDLICWNSVSLEENTIEVRTFMLHSKISETPDFGRQNKKSSKTPAFVALPKFTAANIKQTLDTFEPVFRTNIDGLLFYHPESYYVEGETPCCLWMTMDQVKNLLGFDVKQELIELRNPTYKRQVKDSVPTTDSDGVNLSKCE